MSGGAYSRAYVGKKPLGGCFARGTLRLPKVNDSHLDQGEAILGGKGGRIRHSAVGLLAAGGFASHDGKNPSSVAGD